MKAKSKTSTKEVKFFDVLSSIINKKEIPEDKVETLFSGWQACDWLSNNPMACYTVNHLQSSEGNSKIPKIAEYKFYKNSIKLPKNTYLSFNKKKKDINTIIKAIQIEFSTGRNTAKEYITMLSPNELVKIIEKRAIIGAQGVQDKFILELRLAYDKLKQDILNENFKKEMNA